MTGVQKIQQITILKNVCSAPHRWPSFKKYNKLQSLRTDNMFESTSIRSKNTTNYNP